MVSTVGLAPGASPACSGCGRAFPASMATVSTASGGGRTGSPIVLFGLLVPLVIVGVLFFFLATSRRSENMRASFESASAASAHEAEAESQRRRDLVEQLESDDWNRVIGAWHQLAACDTRDHWGTFADLRKAYASSQTRNCLHLLTGGMCEYYGEPGEKAVTDELVARASEPDHSSTICEALEAFPPEMGKRGGEDARIRYAEKSLRILEAARARLPSGDASRRVLATIRHVKAMLPAEK
jgi:hypothetical protein